MREKNADFLLAVGRHRAAPAAHPSPPPQYVGLIMVKALMHEPEMDFTVVSHVVPEKVQNEESILMVAEAAQRIENGEFNLFWAEHAPKVLKEFKVPGFEDAIRRHIVSVLSRTFQDAPAALCASYVFLVSPLVAAAPENTPDAAASNHTHALIVP